MPPSPASSAAPADSSPLPASDSLDYGRHGYSSPHSPRSPHGPVMVRDNDNLSDLVRKVVNLTLDSNSTNTMTERTADSVSQTPSASISSLGHPTTQSVHTRDQSSSSISSLLYSDASGSTGPPRPRRSPLRRSKGGNVRLGGDVTALMLEIDALQSKVANLLDNIYEIQELRHSTSVRSAPAKLDALISDLHKTIAHITPRISALEASATSPDVQEMLAPLLADWQKVTEQHALLQRELQEDPWLIRFRTTADQADAMMDPLSQSLSRVTAYIGRILGSVNAVPLTAPEGKLSIGHFREMTEAHSRLRSTYVPSVNKILKMMDKSVSDRPVKNGEALRRLNDMNQRWATMQKQLQQLESKIAMVMHQYDPDHSPDDSMEMLSPDGGGYFGGSPTVSSHSSSHENSTPLHRVTSGASVTSMSSYGGSSFSAPYAAANYHHSTPPNHQPKCQHLPQHLPLRTNNSSVNHVSPPQAYKPTPRGLSKSVSTMNVRALGTPTVHRTPSRQQLRPPSRAAPRTSLSQSQSVATSLSSLATPSDRFRRMGGSAIPQPSSFQSPVTPSNTSGLRRPSLAASSASGRMTPGPMARRAMTPGPGVGVSPPSSLQGMPSRRAGLPPMPGRGGRPSFAPAHGNRSMVGPSSFRPASPASVGRPSSRASVMSSMSSRMPHGHGIGVQPFRPSKYDELDLAVQRVLDALQTDIFVARLDPPLRRGQHKADGEWTGEFVFGYGERSNAVKLLEMRFRGPDTRFKVMVRDGGAWHDLLHFLERRIAAAEADVF